MVEIASDFVRMRGDRHFARRSGSWDCLGNQSVRSLRVMADDAERMEREYRRRFSMSQMPVGSGTRLAAQFRGGCAQHSVRGCVRRWRASPMPSSALCPEIALRESSNGCCRSERDRAAQSACGRGHGQLAEAGRRWRAAIAWIRLLGRPIWIWRDPASQRLR